MYKNIMCALTYACADIISNKARKKSARAKILRFIVYARIMRTNITIYATSTVNIINKSILLSLNEPPSTESKM